MDECYDDRLASATRRGSILKWGDGKLCETGDVEAGAVKRVADEGLGFNMNERKGFGDGLVGWYLRYGKGVFAAWSAKKACWFQFGLRCLERCIA